MDQLQEMMASVQKEVEKEEALEEEHQEKESMEMMKEKEREEFDSSDDEDAETTTPVVMSETFNDEWAEFDQDQEQDQDHQLDIEGDFENDLNNDIDIGIEENFVPVDLSNDIAVNDVAAADPDFPHNPDAEVFAPPTLIKAMPMFEKLSLSEPSK
ncbi:retrotransposon Gag-like protein 5 isoform X1 [Drosophila kikkawai]|nr:glutamic acid-rich protein isoform X2 [Drosophila kikkawai]